MRKRICRILRFLGVSVYGECSDDVLGLVGCVLSWSAEGLEDVVSEVFSVSANKGLSQCHGVSLVALSCSAVGSTSLVGGSSERRISGTVGESR